MALIRLIGVARALSVFLDAAACLGDARAKIVLDPLVRVRDRVLQLHSSSRRNRFSRSNPFGILLEP